MSFYSKHILPKFLDITMKSDMFDAHRKSTTATAKGVVLEIGSGSGLNFRYYKGISKLFALEPSREMHLLAKENMKELTFPVEYIESGAEDIPLPDASVDSVVSTWTFCTIPHPEKALAEIRRVLKPGGSFSFVEHGLSPRPFLSKLQSFITPAFKRISGGCHLDRDIERLIRGSDLNIERIEKFPIKLKPLNYMYKGFATR